MAVPTIRKLSHASVAYLNLTYPTNHPRLQIAALPLLEIAHVEQEKIALQKHFKAKRDHVLSRLKKMGLEVKLPPTSTFYIWLDLEELPEPLNNGLTFFEEMLKEKAIVVPGVFFDINPSHRRNLFNSPCHHFVRLSFGPPLEQLDKGKLACDTSMSWLLTGFLQDWMLWSVC
jgi:aspartate/methionine/tyrosine aminotransferase